MPFEFDPSRRRLLKTGASGAALAALTSLPGIGIAHAQAVKPLSFQLSWIKSIQYGGYFAGIENGSFKKYGVEPTFVSGGPNMDPVANVASGQSQIGDRPIGSIIVAKEKGIPVKVIGNVFQKSPYSVLSLAKTPIKTPKDLKGKTVAVSTSGKPLLLNLIIDAGLKPDDVNIVPSAPDPAALVSGQIDGYCGYVTNQGVMLKTRGVDIYAMNAQEFGLPETTGTIYGREDFLVANKDLVVAFLKGAVEAWRWSLANPEPTTKLMVEKYGAPGLNYQAQLTEIVESKPYIEAGAGSAKGMLALDMPLYQDIIDVYRKVGMVKTAMTAKELCDPSYIEAALAGLKS
ncbi:ABC transporter substrate-binding protein [Rhodoplanes sp. Z2-YC6860]|uniref:ABC transporter substrate-binding protein n=1 Tax=Rhodoplanes sp. Z2-YC6860 TaxID=674703 RepID=UPI00078E989D|nr:ABC transporter substrate-binding protein [Rhodoplanes sp. Z2-YC6860]AMN41122.1 ABC transporter substrate-binding protein [Rhodoplanes sp. Z2-YC6860]